MQKKKGSLKKPSGPGRLSAEQAELLPERILDAALHLFNTQGFRETSMDQIAKQASASTKTIYARYASKADILRAVVERIVKRTAAPNEGGAEMAKLLDEPRAYLNALCVSICTRIATEAATFNRLAMSEAHRVPAFRDIHVAAVAHGVRLIQIGLERWRDQKLVTNLGDSTQAGELCLSMGTDWARIETTLGAPPEPAEIKRRVAFAMDVFLRGVGLVEKGRTGPRKSAAREGKA